MVAFISVSLKCNAINHEYEFSNCARLARIDFNVNLHSVCAVYVLQNNDQILDQFFKQSRLRAIALKNHIKDKM